MRRTIIGLTLLVVPGLASTAAADSRRMNAALCNPTAPSDVDKITYSPFGVHNNQTITTIAGIDCGGVSVVNSNVTAIEVIVYDRHPTIQVACSMRVQDLNGNQIAAVLRTSSSGPGSNPQPLTFNPPANTSGMVHISCGIPPASSGNFSHVTSYRITTSP